MNICDKGVPMIDLHKLEGHLFDFKGGATCFKGIAMLCQTGPHVWTFICVKSGNRIRESTDTKDLLALVADVTDQYCLQKVK